jgi:hypothetical protein
VVVDVNPPGGSSLRCYIGLQEYQWCCARLKWAPEKPLIGGLNGS